ncbi:outer membrane beta-barrel protein [Mongoliitalea lutea]|uniref:Outer membrane protein beta-barrel domain-containing protein n=1 Tax=Mongoliitalea lutea TaxID=849756 RepID=A0A8J3D0T4_9BACT|nr:outer membrane beta-barrel protein [Mongoliitalea lutea]GHB52555.1 hypothetical protein GCM10008106_36470 [Mongoliitalea lutea]
MKKHLLLLGILFFLLLESKAQNLEITPFTGYTFNHSLPIVGGRATLGGGQAWGGMLGFQLNDFTEVEVLYSWQGGTSTARSTAIQSNVNTRTNANYIMIGGNRLFPVSSQMAFFSGLKAGAGILAFPDGDFRDISRFAVGLNGGMKYFVSDNIGIRLQANLMMPISNVGANLWWSPGGGTQVGVSGWSSVVQFGFTGGLIFRLAN